MSFVRRHADVLRTQLGRTTGGVQTQYARIARDFPRSFFLAIS